MSALGVRKGVQFLKNVEGVNHFPKLNILGGTGDNIENTENLPCTQLVNVNLRGKFQRKIHTETSFRLD